MVVEKNGLKNDNLQSGTEGCNACECVRQPTTTEEHQPEYIYVIHRDGVYAFFFVLTLTRRRVDGAAAEAAAACEVFRFLFCDRPVCAGLFLFLCFESLLLSSVIC